MEPDHLHTAHEDLVPRGTEDAIRFLETRDVDQLAVGVIGFDQRYLVRVYNRFEATAAGLARDRVLGLHVFESIAPCMNNFMVAQRFEDASNCQGPLDAELDYVLTLRMRPTPVRLRLLWTPRSWLRYVLVHR